MTFDLTPLFRSTIGFDNLSRLMETASQYDSKQAAYPPYNIEKLGEDEYRISMVVAGFGEDDIEITVEDNSLLIAGKAVEGESGNASYLHRGIAKRAFERRFQLADHIKVSGANLENGLLHVELVREVPEEKRPRMIEIERKPARKTIESKKAA
ncbi:MAG: Hsp20 family protein [Rhodospirillaceae bacterium]|nr:Hsp20 family protein [Rhodospirillaceae bacterium]